MFVGYKTQQKSHYYVNLCHFFHWKQNEKQQSELKLHIAIAIFLSVFREALEIFLLPQILKKIPFNKVAEHFQSHIVSDLRFNTLFTLFSVQDVPLAGVVCSYSGAGAAVPALPQRGSARVWPEEADAGSPRWGHRCFCYHRAALEKVRRTTVTPLCFYGPSRK